MAAKKNRAKLVGSLLVADRFRNRDPPKPMLQRGSVTEYRGITKLSEDLAVDNKTISMPRADVQVSSVEADYAELIDSLNYDLTIPPRVPFAAVERSAYKEVENIVFNRWKSGHRDKVFERNIELWRQFWITCERADIIAQIIDARDPAFFINTDIFTMYPKKRHLILYNKADLLSGSFQAPGCETLGVPSHLYSTKDASFNYNLEGQVGLIGYPNVGKSSTINLILKQKKVKASATPGKTKHIQTIETPQFTLLDCPGLVFPCHPKIDLALHGILNVDQIPDLATYEKLILQTVGMQRIASHYKFAAVPTDFINSMANEKGWQKSKCLRYIVKDYTAGIL